MNNVENITNSVSLGQKIAFGLGMLANQLFPALLSIFIVVLIQILGLIHCFMGLLLLYLDLLML
jgi:GPH family glycoside/pentoside/hexuronide:cation symporter